MKIFDVTGWAIGEDQIHSKNEDGTYKLMTLDIDFGIQCSLACPHCFRQDSNFKSPEDELTFPEMKNLLQQAINLGLKHVKIIGAGEPFENSMLIPMVQFLAKNNIDTAIFTKGHILGDDEKINQFFGKYNIHNALELFQFLKSHRVSILLGFNSFNKQLQGDFIGYKTETAIENYTSARNRALDLAIKFGFNEPRTDGKTRLALIAAPIKPENIREVLEIYKFGRKQNIYVLSCPTAESGRGKKEKQREQEIIEFNTYVNQLKKLYIEIYSWAIENNYISINEVEKDGISLYPGCHPCNQVATGMYITLNGKVARCPGRDDDSYIIANNVREKPLKEIWMNSANYRLAAQEDRFNFYCLARDGHFFTNPKEFYSSIEKHLINKYKEEPAACNI